MSILFLKDFYKFCCAEFLCVLFYLDPRVFPIQLTLAIRKKIRSLCALCVKKNPAQQNLDRINKPLAAYAAKPRRSLQEAGKKNPPEISEGFKFY
jgi:hypothetical protein